MHQGQPFVQPARCARGDQRGGAGELYRAGADTGEGVLRGVAGRGNGRSAFLKKRSKKLLLLWFEHAAAPGDNSKSFLVLFFKKELAAFF
jgi:hypothetical protein